MGKITAEQLEGYLRQAVDPAVLKNLSEEKLAQGIKDMMGSLNAPSAEVEGKKGRGI